MSKKYLVYKRSYAAVVRGVSEEEEEEEEIREAKRRSLDPHEQVSTEGRSQIPVSWISSFSYRRYE